MCGIIGIYYHDQAAHVSQGLVDALTVLQHRGQDAAGIVTIDKKRLNLLKDNGTVADVFTQENIVSLQGNAGIGHVRYPTAGGSCSAEAQPFYTNAPFGIALAHNGNLTNTGELRKALDEEFRHTNTNSDSEILLNVFAEELQRRLRNRRLSPEDIFDAVRTVTRRCKGGYAVVMVINTIGLLAFRDPHGIRPLCFGSRRNTNGIDYAVASESVAIDILGPQFRVDRDVRPGEAIFVSFETGLLHTEIVHSSPNLTPCLFEYVYFARPDSVLDGISVYEARINMGLSLAKKILHQHPDLDIDVVIPIPETSRTAALHCAYGLNKPYREAFVKNRYIARTFIMPGQEMRRKTVRLKLNTIKSEFRNKNVLLIDDSIVRGTTSLELIQMARDAGARKVYFGSAAPPVKYPNVYGIDIPTRGELIAYTEPNEEAIAKCLNADLVIYNDLQDVITAVTSLNSTNIRGLDSSCFDGIYVTGDITNEYLDSLEKGRGKGRKTAGVVVPAASAVSAGELASDATVNSAAAAVPVAIAVRQPIVVSPVPTSGTALSSSDGNSLAHVELERDDGNALLSGVDKEYDLVSSNSSPSSDGSTSSPSSPFPIKGAGSLSSNSLVYYDTPAAGGLACEGIFNGSCSPSIEASHSSKKARLA